MAELGDGLPDRREVHVWIVELAAGAAAVETCLRSLSADERERAARFRFERLKTAFTLTRGTLRALLGRYLAMEPGSVRFAYGPRGKPRLALPEVALEFNVSRSGTFAAYAFAAGCPLGVDIEEVRPMSAQEQVVRRFFSPAERQEWLALDASQRDAAFFRCWTRKEAYVKALGDGLAMPLDSFSVSLRPEAPASPIHAAGDPGAASRWSLYSLAPADGYAGALAVPERGRTVRVVSRTTADGVVELGGVPAGGSESPFLQAADEFIAEHPDLLQRLAQ
jgi:4'-phosphopantetheinyl transferase